MQKALDIFKDQIGELVSIILASSKTLGLTELLEDAKIESLLRLKEKFKHNEPIFYREWTSEKFIEIIHSNFRSFICQSMLIKAISIFEEYLKASFQETYASSRLAFRKSSKEVKLTIAQLNSFETMTDIRNELLKRELSEYASFGIREKLERLTKYRT